MDLSNLKPPKGAKHSKKRVGLTGHLWRHIERRAKERRIGGGNRVQEKQPQKQTGAHHQPLI